MSRQRAMIAYGGLTLATIVLFAVFIAFRDNAALISALSAAGTVAAAGFAALAAMGSMRAAAESSATSKRSQESLARTVRPRLRPVVSQRDGTLFGTVVSEGGVAIDVIAVWMAEGDSVTGQAARLEPVPGNLPPDADDALTVDLKVPDTTNPRDHVTMVWLEYWDDNRLGKWRDTWQWGTGPQAGMFIQTESEMVG